MTQRVGPMHKKASGALGPHNALWVPPSARVQTVSYVTRILNSFISRQICGDYGLIAFSSPTFYHFNEFLDD